MRLHRLQVAAFGPFADTADIDLDALGAGGLFLIHGATGAGKTSLLDAVAFALYADVPGARSKKGLHSDHASRGSVPSVTLDFSASGRRLRVERSPEFSRPKARGTGDTTVPAKAVLWEHRGGTWQALSTRHDEIADVVKDVLGLGLEQFSKVVLLPQGEFAAFLRATPEERRTLLERLFDVTAYAGIEDWFAVRRKESGAALDSHRAGLRADLAVLADVLADAPPRGEPAADEVRADGPVGPDWGELPLDGLPLAIESVRTSLVDASIESLTSMDAARLADSAATTAHAAAAETSARRGRGLLARARAAELEDGREAHEAAVARLEVGARAASVSGDLKGLARAEEAVRAARGAVDDTADGVEHWGLGDGSPELADEVRSGLEHGATSLADAARVHRTLDARRRVRAELAARSTQLSRRGLQLTEQLAQQTAAAELAQQRLGTAQEAVAGLELATTRVAQLQAAHRVRADLDAGLVVVEQSRARLVAARGTAQDLREVYQDLRQARLDGMAGELAARLADGQPCPVCGAADHPAPASGQDSVTADAVADAEHAWQETVASVSRAEAAISALDAEQAQRLEQLADESRDADALAQALATAGAELSDLRRRAADVEPAQAQVGEVAAGLDSLTARGGEVHDALTAATASIAAVDADLASQEAAVSAAMSAHAQICPCLEGRRDRSAQAAVDAAGLPDITATHLAASTALDQHSLAADALARAVTELAAIVAAVRDTLAAVGFSDANQARAGQLTETETSSIRSQVAAHEGALVAVRTTLEDPEILAALSTEAPDLELLARRRDDARTAYATAVSVDTLVRRTLAGVERLHGSITQRCHQIITAAADDEVLRELAETVAGTSPNNTRRMRLSAFVLAARLEKVATLANERLATMGEGRYQLRHTDDLAARGARSGLGLEVLDLWTGQTRDTSSLSGGESFMASLALALGLADAVREESGGFDLQTLFVDEGFGTLDDESLEQVMTVLDELREGGRAVGVVSHVAELRTRIPSQLVVSKTEHGSTVRVTVTGEAAPAA